MLAPGRLAESGEAFVLKSSAFRTSYRYFAIRQRGWSRIDFNPKTIRVSKSSDDNTRDIRQPKTKNSSAMLPMPSALEAMLRKYLENHWKPNPSGFLFPNAKGTHPRSRDNVVKYGLKPVLKQWGIPAKDTVLHAFRHGLATELAEQAVPLTVLQQQMRHADIKTESTLTRFLRRSGR